VVLALKDIVERLGATDAQSLAVDPDALVCRTVAELTADEKAMRDAGPIAVPEIAGPNDRPGWTSEMLN
jgi:hypothetical protein